MNRLNLKLVRAFVIAETETYASLGAQPIQRKRDSEGGSQTSQGYETTDRLKKEGGTIFTKIITPREVALTNKRGQCNGGWAPD